MAKILVDARTLELMPDFIQQVIKLVGKIVIVDSLFVDGKELLFPFKNFEYNEVVLARITKSTVDDKLKVTSINSTASYYIHYA